MGRYGMAGDHYRQSGYVTLQDVPDPNREYVETFQNLTGGMNRFDLDYRLKGNESPFMQNLSWHNGTLTSRLGQVEKYDLMATVTTVAPFLFHGWLLSWSQYRGDGDEEYLYTLIAKKVRLTGEAESESAEGQTQYIPLFSYGEEVTEATFFQYRDKVFVKSRGYYGYIVWDHTDDSLTSTYITTYVSGEISVADQDVIFTPLFFKNTNPASGAGSLYQRPNRLSPLRKVEFNVTAAGTTSYQLPEAPIDYIDKIEDEEGNVYAVSGQTDYTTGLVVLGSTPPDADTKLYITYSYDKDNSANTLLLDSPAAIVFGGAQELCIVMGGPKAQPNAYFWSGLGRGDAMDPTYFPDNQWNLAGEVDARITCFGKQQNMLVIFQPNATGRAVFGTETLDGLVQITMNYTRINAEIGCDLPGSLQLVENNLVWCNRRYGVCRLKDSSAAYENNIVQISRKINGDYRLDGLLEQLKSVADDEVRSVDTGKRYILVLGDQDGKAYEWNYELSKYEDPSWFFHTNILGVGFVPLANEELYEVTADGKVCAFEMVFSDFGTEPINKIYRFPPRDFGSYDRLKNIKSILVTTRSDAKTNTQLKYTCDYAERVDPTNLVVILNRLLYAAVFRRKPGYHNIHHLGIELSNNVAGDDLNIVSAQIFYEYRGRTR